MSRRATKPAVAVTEAATHWPVTVPNLAELCLGAPAARRGAPTGEFYALPPAEAAEAGRDAMTLEAIPANAERDAGNATFRLPFPELAPKNADGSYKYRVYDAAWLWGWVCAPGRASDPLDRTPLLRRDWEELRDRYSSAAAHPTPGDGAFRAPITTGLWPPGVPYVPPPPPPPLTDATIHDAVDEALKAGGPEYVHPGYGPIAGWDVGAVTNMRGMFRFVAHVQGHAYTFNGDLSRWDVRNVTDMDRTFEGARAFNGDLKDWKVGAVTNMDGMFDGAAAFNGDLSRWDVRNVTGMSSMFEDAAAFSGDLSRWDVRNVTNMAGMFQEAAAFNGDLSRWDVRNVTDMEYMFAGAVAYRPEHEIGSRSAWFYVGGPDLNFE